MKTLDAAFAAIDEATGDSDSQQLIATKCKALMVGYETRWAGADWRATSLEQWVTLPLINPETGRASRTWKHAGKWDGIVVGYDKTALLEHKSVSATEDIADPSSTYWRRLAIDSQVSTYQLQSWQSGIRLDGTLYDVIRKPGIRPKRLSAAERKQVLATGHYCGATAPDEALASLGDSECLTLYGMRLAAEVVAEPQRYYQRRMIHRLDHEIVEYAGELWEIGQEIQRAKLLGLNFRNSDSCMAYGTPCRFLGICSGADSPDSDKWTRMANVHRELDGIEGDGRDVLTNSRIKTFQACRQKHHLQYGLGLVRADDEESEALYFGAVIHKALEAWWSLQGSPGVGDVAAPSLQEVVS